MGAQPTPTSCSPTPRCCTPACCPTIGDGRRSWGGCATSWSTSCTCSAACSARTWRTCCAGCVGCATSTAPDPTFVFSSATIGDPAQLASDLCGLPVLAVTDDGSPRGPRTFALLNPPLLDVDNGVRTSTNSEAAAVSAKLIELGLRTDHVLPQSQGTEFVAADIRTRLPCRPVGSYPLVPRGLPRRRAARDRRRARARRGRRHRRHHRARARGRHRRRRRLRARRVSRHDRVDVAASGPRRARPATESSPCSSPAKTSSTSGSWRTRTSCSPDRPSRR